MYIANALQMVFYYKTNVCHSELIENVLGTVSRFLPPFLSIILKVIPPEKLFLSSWSLSHAQGEKTI